MKRKCFMMLMVGMLALGGCGSEGSGDGEVLAESQTPSVTSTTETVSSEAENTVSEMLESAQEEVQTSEEEDGFQVTIAQTFKDVKNFAAVNNGEVGSAIFQDVNGTWYWLEDYSAEPKEITGLNASYVYSMSSEGGYFAYNDPATGLWGVMYCSDNREGIMEILQEPCYNNLKWNDNGTYLGIIGADNKLNCLVYGSLVSGKAEDITNRAAGFEEVQIDAIALQIADGNEEIVLYGRKSGDEGYYTRVYDPSDNSGKVMEYCAFGRYFIYGNGYVSTCGVYRNGDGKLILAQKLGGGDSKASVKDGIYLSTNYCMASSDGWISCTRLYRAEDGKGYDVVTKMDPDAVSTCFYNARTGQMVMGMKGATACSYRSSNGNRYAITKADQVVFEEIVQEDGTIIYYPYDLVTGTVMNDAGFLYIADSVRYETEECRKHRLVQLLNGHWGFADENYAIQQEYDDATDFSMGHATNWAAVVTGDSYCFINDSYEVISDSFRSYGQGVSALSRDGHYFRISNGDVFDVVVADFVG